VKAFLNKKLVKTKYLNRVIAHRKADEIVKGMYWENGKGCAVGCTVHSSRHDSYETELGIPSWLAQLEDTLFEHVSNKYGKTFPERFLNAIPVGVDLAQVKSKFLIFVLKSVLTKFDHEKFPKSASSIKAVIKLYKDGETDLQIFKEACQNAYAAYAAAYTVTSASAAYAVTSTAAYAAYSYTADTAIYAAAYAARTKEYEKFANYLLKLLKAAK
jgi:hypothetical protein